MLVSPLFFSFTRLDPAYTSLRAMPSHLLRRARVAFASGDPLVVVSLYTRFGVCATYRHPLFERPANYRGGTLSSSLSISRDGALSSSMGLAMVRPTLNIEGRYKPKGGIKDLVLGVYMYVRDKSATLY